MRHAQLDSAEKVCNIRAAMRALRTSDSASENVITIDTDSAPRILFYGEDFLCEDLPVGTRVI